MTVRPFARRSILLLGFLGIACAGATAPAVAADCVLGNAGTASSFVEDYLVGEQSFAYFLDPADPRCCETGLTPEQATFYVNVPTADDLCYFPLYFSMHRAFWDAAAGAYVPGAEECSTGVHLLNADVTGVYTVSIPIWGGHPGGFTDCDCLSATDPWFIVMHVPSTIGENIAIDPAHDSAPVGGRSYVDIDGEWQDLVNDHGWPGELLMSVSVTCCTDPVGDGEPTGLDRFKSWFR